MGFVMRALVLLALMPAVNGAYSCPSMYDAKAGTPSCDGVDGGSCSLSTCCTLTGTLCSATDVISGNVKCKAGSDTNMFFDLKKGSSTRATSSSDDDFRETCCSACSAATCSDWQTVKPLVGCPTGKTISGAVSLASADCSVPTDASYKGECCIGLATCSAHTCSSGMTKKANSDTRYCAGTDASSCNDWTCCTQDATLCSATNVVSGNVKCKTGPSINKFFDLQKSATTVGSTFDGCCTSCSEATCGDWQPIKLLLGCPAGKSFDAATPLASSDCSVPSDNDYTSTCCATPPVVCAATDAVTGNVKCKAGNDANQFFDLKKSAAVLTSDSDELFRTECCSSCSTATCADWQPVKFLVGCPTGKSFFAATALASADCSIPSDDDYKSTCCSATCGATDAVTGNVKCKAGNDANQFFDLKKSAAVLTSDSDELFRTECCSSCSTATCADWQPVKFLVGCPTGKSFFAVTALASADCSIPSDDDYKSTCCAITPETCGATNVITGDAQCKVQTLTKFYDLKKQQSLVGSDSNADFQSACCTDCSAATCADWQSVKPLVACGAGKVISGTKSFGSSDCSIPSDDEYKGTCCVGTMKCADYTEVVDDEEASRASSFGFLSFSAFALVASPSVF